MANKEAPPERVKSLLSSFIFENSNDEASGKSQEQTVLSPAAADKGSATRYSPGTAATQNSPSKPMDRDAFLKRLHTFTPMTWFAKPAWLSPLLCARYGWNNVEEDMLQCVSCRAHISGRMPSTFDTSIREEFCEKLATSITNGHHKCCPWPTNPTPVSVYAVPPIQRQTAADQFVSRAMSLVKLAARLPVVSNTTYTELGLEESSLQKLSHVKSCNGEYMSGDDTWNTLSDMCVERFAALIPDMLNHSCLLALTGWQAKGQYSEGQVECALCQRVLGLWNFLCVESQQDAAMDINMDLEPLLTQLSSGHDQQSGDAHPLEQIMALDMLMKMSRPPAVSESEGEKKEGDMEVEEEERMKPHTTQDPSDVSTDFMEAIMAVDTVLKMTQVGEADKADRDTTSSTAGETTNGVSHSESETTATLGSDSPTSKTESEQTSSKSTRTDSLSLSEPSPEKPSSPPQDIEQSAAEQKSIYTEESGSKLMEIVSRLQQQEPEASQHTETQGEQQQDLSEPQQGQESPTQQDEASADVRAVLTELVDRVTETESADSESPSSCSRSRAKKPRLDTPVQRKDFHPVREHYDWCPWVATGIWPSDDSVLNPHSNPLRSPSSNQSGKWIAGWKKLLYILLPETNPNTPKTALTTPTREGLKNIRSILQKWT